MQSIYVYMKLRTIVYKCNIRKYVYNVYVWLGTSLHTNVCVCV